MPATSSQQIIFEQLRAKSALAQENDTPKPTREENQFLVDFASCGSPLPVSELPLLAQSLSGISMEDLEKIPSVQKMLKRLGLTPPNKKSSQSYQHARQVATLIGLLGWADLPSGCQMAIDEASRIHRNLHRHQAGCPSDPESVSRWFIVQTDAIILKPIGMARFHRLSESVAIELRAQLRQQVLAPLAPVAVALREAQETGFTKYRWVPHAFVSPVSDGVKLEYELRVEATCHHTEADQVCAEVERLVAQKVPAARVKSVQPRSGKWLVDRDPLEDRFFVRAAGKNPYYHGWNAVKECPKAAVAYNLRALLALWLCRQLELLAICEGTLHPDFLKEPQTKHCPRAE